MTKIRVAYDISILATFFDRVDSKTGVYRVIEEVLTQMCARDDVEMTAVGLCGINPLSDRTDPLEDSIRALLYLENRKPAIPSLFSHTFRSRIGLTRLYADVFRATLSGALDRLPPRSSRALYLRGARALLYRLAHTYRLDTVRRSLDRERFDVFHCPYPKLPPADITGDLPRVVTIYDVIPVVRPDFVSDRHTAYFKGLLERIDVKRDWVTCISEFSKGEFCEYSRMSPDRVFVTHLAASDHFRPCDNPEPIVAMRRRYGILEGDYFLCLAAPQPRKNLAHLIRCFFRLLDEGRLTDTYLVLAGSKEQGWMHDEVFAAAESSPAHRSQIIFTGYVDDEDLAPLYSGALAFIYPSLYEGFGLPALEALACGTAVITSNTTSMPEVVGNAALLVDPTDADALCQAMLTLAMNEDVRSELRSKGLKQASKFSWQKCADKTAEAYHAAASTRLGRTQ